MVAIVSGNGLGLYNSSLNLLGSGTGGQPGLGRLGEQLYVNSATGNLIIQQQDEYLASLGLDLGIIRTYNSQGTVDGDNNDSWRIGVYRSLYTLTGTVNTAGSTINKVYGDGHEAVFSYDASRGLYTSADGEGAHDTLAWNSGTAQWTFSDGSPNSLETYNSAGRLLSTRDADGNSTAYTYTGNLITRIDTAAGESVFLDYTGSNLSQIRTVTQGATETKVRYGYDTQNRLTSVTVDLTAADNSISDGQTYVTAYTYDGSSTRIASITQGDGSAIAFSYVQVNGQWKVQTVTDGVGAVSTFSYTDTGSFTPVNVSANPAVLSTTETQISYVPYNLNSGALTPNPGGWSAATLLETSATVANDPKVAFDASGNGFALWRAGGDLFMRRYTAAANTWSAAVTLETRTNTVYAPSLAVDTNGNAIVAWVQSDGTANSAYANTYNATTQTWSGAQLLETGTTAVATATGTLQATLNSNGQAAVAWLQTDGTRNNLYAARFSSNAWSAATLLESSTNAAAQPAVSIDASGNVTTLWQQSDGTANSIYGSRFQVSTNTWSTATLLETSATVANDPKVAFDASGNGFAVWRAGGDLFMRRYTAAANTWSAAVTLETRTNTVYAPSLAVDTNGNAIVAWVQSDGTANSAYANRYTASTNTWSGAQLLETGTTAVATATGTLQATLNSNGQAAVAWLQTDGTRNNLYAARFSSNAWSAAALLESSTNAAAQPAVSIDASGNVTTLWQQSDGTANSIYGSRYTVGTGLGYTIPSGATWSSIATTLYGTSNVADELQAHYAALGITTLTAGNTLANPPATLTDTVTSQVPVDPYYSVPSGATWASITQTVYATSAPEAIAALQAALGNPALTTGLHLTVPQTLNYNIGTVTGHAVDVIDALGHTTTYTSDTQGRLTDVNAPSVNGTRASTHYAYDAQNNVTSITDANNHSTALAYDSAGNLISRRDAAGNTVTYTYSSNNLLLTQTVYLVPDADGAGAAQPGTPLTTRFAYDSEHHLRFSVSAEGRVSEYRYAANGNRTSAIQYSAGVYAVTGLNPADALTEAQLSAWVSTQDQTQTERSDYSYDFRGQVSSITTYTSVDASGAGIADGGQSITQFIYDAHGRLLQSIDARGTQTAAADDYVTTYTYDSLGRLLTTAQWIDASHTRTTVTSYDDAGHRTATTLENGLTTTHVYDLRGALISQIQSDPNGTLGTTRYQYDAAGRLRSTTDPTGLSTNVLYDEAGRLVARIDAAGGLTESVYDANGNLIRTIGYATRLTQAQLTALNALDAQGQAANVIVGSIRPAPSADDRSAYVLYDRANRPVLSITPHDTDPTQGYVTQNFYDGAGRITDVVRYATAINTSALPASPIPDDVPITTDAALDRHSRTFYDKDGNPVGSLDAEGYLTEYQYLASGELRHSVRYASATAADLRTSGDFAALKQSILNQGNNPDDQHSYAFYNSQGQLIASLDAENFLTEYRYDLAGNRTQELRYYARANNYTGTQTVTDLRPTNQSARITVTEYNGANQITQVTTLPDNTVSTYTYDDLGQLISTTRAQGTNEARTSQARYDRQGRMTQELTGQGSAALQTLLTQNPGATQTEIDAVWTAYGIAHSYDAAGRRTATTDQNHHSTFFYYDNANRLSYTVNALGEVSQSVYNAFGEVIDTRRYTNRLSTTGMTGGLISADLETRIAAIATPTGTNADAHSQINYTLRGAIKEILAAPDNAALTSATRYTYNAFGERASSWQQLTAAGQGVTNSYTYDRRGLATDTYEDTAGLNRHTSVQVDAFGRITQRIDANGILHTARYDRLGRTVTSTHAFGTAAQSSTSQSYDAFGRMLTQTDALNHTTTYVFDDATRSFTITTPEGIRTSTQQNRHGQTVAITDGNNNTTTYNYDKNGALTGTTDALTHSTQHVYDQAGLERLSIDANGHVTVFSYDAANRLISRVVDPQNYTDANGNPVSNTNGLNLTTSHVYDGQGRTLTSTDGNGVVTLTQYDAKGQVSSITIDPQSYPDANGNTVSKPSGLNVTTAYRYDARGKTLTVTEGAGTPEARTTQYAYDNLGRRTQQIQDAITGGLNIVTAYSYDNNDNVIVTVEAQGKTEARTTRYVYDAQNRPVYTIDALGDVTEQVYDANGNVIETRAYATAFPSFYFPFIDASSNRQVTVQAMLTPGVIRSEVRVYDRDNRQRFTIDPLGYVKETTYTKTGQVQDTIAYAAPLNTTAVLTVAGINPSGLSADQIRAAMATALTPEIIRIGLDTSDPLNQTTTYAYDKAGRLESTADAQHKTEYYAYDAVGNKIAFTNKKGITPGNPDYTWHYKYDAANRLIEERTPAVAVTRLTTGTNGQITPVTTNEAVVTRMTYDGLGNVSTRTEAWGTVDARTTTYNYDAAGRQTQTIFPPESFYNATLDAQNGYTGRNESTQTPTSTTYYDALGQAVASQDVQGVFSYKAYDAAGRVQVEIDAERYVTQYTYDAFGNQKTLTRYANPLAESFFTSREQAATSTTVQTYSFIELQGLIAPIADASQDRTITNRYDLLGRVTETKQPAVYNYDSTTETAFTAAPTTHNDYNAFGQATRQRTLTNTNGINASDYATQSTAWTWADSYFYYNERGEKTATVDALGYLTTYQYDAQGNLTETTEYAQALTPGRWNTQSYGTPTPTVPTGANSTSATGFDRTTRFEYDVLNRKTEEIKVSVQYATATYNGIVTPTNQLGNLTTSYGYDELGNLTRTTDQTGANAFTYYDVLGRTTGVAEPFRFADIQGSVSLPPLTLTPHYLDLASTSSAFWYAGDENTQPSWVGTPAVALKWSSLEDWGSGNVRVQVDYRLNSMTDSYAGGSVVSTSTTQTLSAVDGATGASFNLNTVDHAVGPWIPEANYRALTGIDRIRVWKTVDGVEVLVHDTTGVDRLQTATLSWQKSPVEGTQVELRYRVAGSSNAWSTLSTASGIETRGSRYWVSLSSLPIGQYEYVLTYKRPNETQVYAQGTGVFAVATTTAVGSIQIAGFVEEPYLDLVSTSSAFWYAGDENTQPSWVGTPAVALKWSSLEDWGSGNVRVQVDYRLNSMTDSYAGGSVVSTSTTQTLSAVDGATGASFNLNTVDHAVGPWIPEANYRALTGIDRIRVWKVVDGVEVLVQDSTVGDLAKPERLILRGNTTNLTGVEIRNEVGTLIDTRTLANNRVTHLGSGVYAVDVSDLARGRYTFTPVINGVATTYSQGFEVHGSGAAGSPVIQENVAYLDLVSTSSAFWYAGDENTQPSWVGTPAVALKWSSLEDWGSGNVRVQVDYRLNSMTDSYAGGSVVSTSTTQTLSAVDGATGASFNLNTVDHAVGPWIPEANYRALTGIDRIRVWKVVDGVEVLVHDTTGDAYTPRLEFSSLPATAQTVTFEYRKAGSTDPFLPKTTTKIGSGWFTANYDDIPVGAYEYRLTVLGADGPDADTNPDPIDLTSVGGNSAGQISGTIEIKRGGQSLPSVQDGGQTVLTPLTTLEHDIFGNVVVMTRHGDGAANANEDGYIANLINAATDATSYVRYNDYGQAIESIDALGHSVYQSFDAQGHLRKAWTYRTDADRAIYQDTTVINYDRLGHKTETSEASLNTVTAIPASLTLTSQYLDLSTSSPQWVPATSSGYNTIPGYWTGSPAVALKWSSLEDWGSGNVRVQVDYRLNSMTDSYAGGSVVSTSTTQTLSAVDGATGASFNLNTVDHAVGPWIPEANYRALTGIDRIRVWKTVDGVEVLVHDTTGVDRLQTATLSWQKSPVEGTQVELRYRVAGSSNAWSTLSTASGIETRGSRYWVSLSSLPIGQYEYVLTYKRPNETQVYAQGTGVFAVATTTAVGSIQIAGFVEEPYLDLVSTSSAFWYAGDENTQPSWVGTPAVALKWSSLEDWGSGNVRVQVDYRLNSMTDSYAGGSVVSTSTTQTLSAVDGATGASFNLNTVDHAVGPWIPEANYRALTGIDRIRVWKVVDGVEVLVQDSTVGDLAKPERLILRGNTTNLTGVEIRNEVGTLIDTRTLANNRVTHLGSGVYAVDVSDLARGRYTFTPVINGVATTYSQGFEVHGSGAAGSPVIQENVAYLDLVSTSSAFWYAGDENTQPSWVGTPAVALKWSSLEDWGSGNVRVQVDYRLNSMTDSYAGGSVVSTSTTQTLSAVDGATGASFNLNTVDHAVGPWIPEANYRALTGIDRIRVWKVVDGVEVLVHDTTGDAYTPRLEFSSLPATAQTVTFEYRKAGSTDPFLPKTTTKIGSGWFTANYDDIPVGAYEYRLTVLGADGPDADTNPDPIDLTSVGGNSAGQISGTIEIKRGGQDLPSSPGNVVTLNKTSATYNSFGEVIAKNLNGGSQEYFDYDQSGRLWRTNQQDGINKVYLYNLTGQATADIRSETANLRGLSIAQASGLTNTVRTETVYDAIGRAITQRQPVYSYTNTPLESISATLTLTPHYLDLASTSSAFWYAGDENTQPSWVGTPAVALKWSSLEDWGSGNVRVQVDYRLNSMTDSYAGGSVVSTSTTQTLSAVDGATGASFNLNTVDHAVGPWIPEANYRALTGIDRIRVWKTVDGVEVLVHDTTGVDRLQTATLSWQKSPVEGTQVELRYRVAGSSNAWSTLSTASGIETRGSRYWVSLSSLPIGQYEYVLTYKRPNETQVYAQGTGVFAVATTTAVGSIQIAGFVEEPYLDLVSTSSAFWYAGDENTQPSWVGTPAVALKWSSLEDWGSGNVRVQVDYRLNSMTDSYAGGSVVSTSTTQTLSAVDGATGASFNLNTVDHAVGPWIPEANYRALTGIDRIRVWKVVDGVEVLVQDSTVGDLAKPERLILRGNTTNLTGVEIRNEVGTLIDTRTLANNRVTHLGSGVYAVDVSDLARGRYTFTPVINGVATTYSQGFEVHGSGAAGSPVIQENVAYLDLVSTSSAFWYAGDENTQPSWVGTPAVALKWSSLEDWGSGNVRVQVDYRLNSMTDSYAGGSVVSTSTTQTLSAVDGATGASFNLNTVDHAVGPWIPEANYRALTGIDRIRVWKVVDGVEVLVHDTTGDAYTPRLEFSSLPATAQTVTFEYRKAGSTDPFLSKTTTKIGQGWFTASYDDIPIASYEYRLIIDGDSTNPVTGSIEIRKGGQSLVLANDPVTATYAPVVSQSVDRWGNVLTSTGLYDTLNPSSPQRTTTYRYNYMNQMVEEVKPATDIWTETGVSLRADANSANDSPTTHYYYDARGQALATRDANGALHGQRYDEAGQVTAEYRADGTQIKHVYDALGQEIARIDGNGVRTEYTYDQNGQLKTERSGVNTAWDITQSYAYDEAGHRTQVTNGEGGTTTFFYDARGNVVHTRRPLDTATLGGLAFEYRSFYDARGNKTREENRLGDYQTWTYDEFGRVKTHRDLGGITTTNTYNALGRLIGQTTDRVAVTGAGQNQDLTYQYYQNGALRRIVDNTLRTETTYEIDLQGNHTRERFVNLNTGEVYQDVHMTYDELGRLTQLKDNRYDLKYAYDALGNRRHITTTYYDNAGQPHTLDSWYAYDAMGRIVLAQGILQNGQIVITGNNGTVPNISTPQGTQIFYDGNGNRTVARTYEKDSNGNATRVEDSYHFDSQNRLIETFRGGQLTSVRNYDQAGRQIEYVAYSSPGVMQERRVTTYNDNGQQLKQENRDGSNNLTATIKYNYTDSYDAAGNLRKYTVENHSGTRYLQTYTYDYLKAGSYQQQAINGSYAVYYPSGTTTSTGKTTFFYDANGNQIRITDSQDATKNRDLIVTTQGQILQQLQNGKKQYYYYAQGQSVGSVGDLQSANFDYNYTPVGTNYPAVTPSSYVVNQGDTLQGIALAVFGDAGLWYLIADANGLKSNTDLKTGQTLTIPNQITNVHSSYGTFKPYSPGEIFGNTTPTTPTPEPLPVHSSGGGGGCGVLGQIIVMIVVIVVAFFTEQWWLVEMGAEWAWAAPIVGAAAGSIAGQLTGMALGIQSEFSWGAVATAALTAGLTGGVSAEAAWYEQAAQGALNNVVTQGINIITGQQEKFDWAGVVTAAVAAPITASLTKGFGSLSNTTSLDGFTLEGFGADLATGLIKGTVSQGVRILVDGRGKMDWSRIATDAFGNAIGNGINAEILWADRNFKQMDAWEKIWNENEKREAEGKSLLYYKSSANGNPVPMTVKEMFDSGDPGAIKTANRITAMNNLSQLSYEDPRTFQRLLDEYSIDNGANLNERERQVAEMLNQVDQAGWRLNGSYGYTEIDNLKASDSWADRYLKPQGAFQAWVNDGLGDATLAFKGSVQASDWLDGLNPLSMGANTYETVRSQARGIAQQMFNDGYNISTTGHSLGGAQAQSFALEFGAPHYVFNALPVSMDVLAQIASDRNQSVADALGEYNSLYDSMRIVSNGEIATAFYDLSLGQNYLDPNSMTLASGLETRSVSATFGLLLLGAVPFGWAAGVALLSFMQHPLGEMGLATQRPVAGGASIAWWSIDPNGQPIYAT